jgi:predicted secreted protein
MPGSSGTLSQAKARERMTRRKERGVVSFMARYPENEDAATYTTAAGPATAP